MREGVSGRSGRREGIIFFGVKRRKERSEKTDVRKNRREGESE